MVRSGLNLMFSYTVFASAIVDLSIVYGIWFSAWLLFIVLICVARESMVNAVVVSEFVFSQDRIVFRQTRDFCIGNIGAYICR